eukprot:gene7320-biopygen9068
MMWRVCGRVDVELGNPGEQLPGHPARCTLPRAGLRAKTPGGAGWTSVARETQCPWVCSFAHCSLTAARSH